MKIPILSYHSISNDICPLSLKIDHFEKQLIYLKKNKYESIYLDEINPDKKKQIIITFDDGYKDLLHLGLPILKKYNFEATCFLVSNLIGKKNSWDSLRDDFKPKEEIKEVTEILEEMEDTIKDTIKDKTIHLLKKEDQHVFFPDLPELVEGENGGNVEEEKEKLEDIKVIQVTKDDPVMNGGTSELKTISINPQYVAKD